MRRLIFIAGIVLIVFAWADLILFIIAPAIFIPMDNAPLLKGIIQIAVCRPDEVLSAEYSTYETPGTSSTNIDMACVDSQQNSRDVSQQIISAGAVGYLVPFLIGLFTTMLARPSKNKPIGKIQSGVSQSDSADLTAHENRLAMIMEIQKKANSGESVSNVFTNNFSRTQDGSDHVPLANRLRELKQAYTEGLITEAEYKSKHKELLDES